MDVDITITLTNSTLMFMRDTLQRQSNPTF